MWRSGCGKRLRPCREAAEGCASSALHKPVAGRLCRSGAHESGAAHVTTHTRCSSALSLQRQGLTRRRPAVQTRYTPEQGMGMLGLEQVQLFWERSLDTKVLIGWSSDTIVISVRGTASLRNAIADIQVRP